MSVLSIDNLSSYYGKARALSSVSLSVSEGEIVALIGANGAGKSTLMDSIMGLVETRGSINFFGDDISRIPCSRRVWLGLGYAPERAHLFSHMSVLDNLLVGSHTSRSDTSKNLEFVLSLFPALRDRLGQETSTQSGGERQMVSLGRALMSSPSLLLVDEPTIGLAPKVCSEILDALRRLNREHGLSILISEQNVNFAMTLASRVHVLETGEIRSSGTPDELRHEGSIVEAYLGS